MTCMMSLGVVWALSEMANYENQMSRGNGMGVKK